jgi:serine protease Do
MLKRKYLIFSLVVALGGLQAGSLASADSQKDKEKEKAEQKDAWKESEKAWTLAQAPLVAFQNTGSYLGVYLEEVSSERAKELRLGEERGAIVMKVVEGSAAEKAGLKENDVITSFNGRRVDTVRELQRLLSETPPGREVQFEVMRGGGRQTINATMTKRSSEFTFQGNAFDVEALRGSQEAMKRSQEMIRRSQENLLRNKDLTQNWGKAFGDFNFISPGGYLFYRGSRLGIAVESLTDQLAEYFGVKSGHGLLVAEVRAESAAAKAGLKAGDVITAIDGQKVDNISDLLNGISKKAEGTVTLTIVRNKSEQTIAIPVEKSERQRLAPRTRTRVLAGASASSF